MPKNLLRLVSLFLILVFGLTSISYAELSPADLAKAQQLLKTQSRDKDRLTQPQIEEQPKITEPKEIPSDIESFFNDSLSSVPTSEGLNPIKQFGYDFFKKASAQSQVQTSGMMPETAVDPNYIVGPGDSFAITLWGITEGIYNAKVNSEGKIILPKAGPINVAGLRYADLKPFIEKELGKYFEKVNVDINITNIKNIWVYVVGEVANPGSYSISSLSTVYNALFAAGGPTERGTLRDIRLLRGGKIAAHLDFYEFLMNGDKNQDRVLQDGDTIFVPLIGPTVGVAGNVYRPAIYEIKSQADLSDIIRIAGGLLPTGSSSRIQIERVITHQKRIITDIQIKYSGYIPKLFMPVMNMDLVKIYPIYSGIGNIVYLEGNVKYPGAYELKPDMTIKDILPNLNALTFGAYLSNAEIIRTNPKDFKTEIIEVSLKKLFAGDENENKTLQSGDRIMVAAEIKPMAKVTLSGEFVAPGVYYICAREKLSSVIERTGGFTPDAYLYGAVLTRTSAAEIQNSITAKLVAKMEKDITQKEQDVLGGTLDESVKAARLAILSKNKELIEKLKGTMTNKGRVIISLDSNLEKFAGSPSDIALEDGDQMMIPKKPNIINVIGEVYNPNSVVYESGQNVNYYVSKVGGPTKDADRGSIYVVRADGSVLSKDQGVNISAVILFPGDSVLIPVQVEKFDLWLAVRDTTQWVYQLALTAAVIVSIIK